MKRIRLFCLLAACLLMITTLWAGSCLMTAEAGSLAQGTLSGNQTEVTIRKGAGDGYAQVAKLPKNSSVPYYATQKANGVIWYYVDYHGTYGWVSDTDFNAPNGASSNAGATARVTATPGPSKPAVTAAPTATAQPSVSSILGYITTEDEKSVLRASMSDAAEQVTTLKTKGILTPWYEKRKSGGVTWYYVKSGKKYGWVNGSSFTETLPTALPAPTEMGLLVLSKNASNIREGAGKNHKKIGMIQTIGTVIPYYGIKKNGDAHWYYILYNGMYGWVMGSNYRDVTGTATVSPTEKPTPTEKATATAAPKATPTASPIATNKIAGYIKTTSKVNVRSGPGTGYSRVTSIGYDTVVPWYASRKMDDGTWYYVCCEHKYGWVLGTYVTEVEGGLSATKPTVKATATPKPKKTATPTPKKTATPKPKLTATPKKTATPTPKKTATPKPKVTATPKKTATPTPKKTATPKPKATATPKAKVTATPKPTATPNPYLVSDGRTTMIIYPAEKIDWFTGGINKLYPRGSTFKIYDVKAKKIWSAYRQAGGSHADIEPATAADTAVLCSIYGVSTADEIASKNKWQRRPCLITIGTHTYACSLYGIPHGRNSIRSNKMNGQICLHFTNSKTHGTARVCPYHQAAINYAYSHAPNGHK